MPMSHSLTQMCRSGLHPQLIPLCRMHSGQWCQSRAIVIAHSVAGGRKAGCVICHLAWRPHTFACRAVRKPNCVIILQSWLMRRGWHGGFDWLWRCRHHLLWVAAHVEGVGACAWLLLSSVSAASSVAIRPSNLLLYSSACLQQCMAGGRVRSCLYVHCTEEGCIGGCCSLAVSQAACRVWRAACVVLLPWVHAAC